MSDHFNIDSLVKCIGCPIKLTDNMPFCGFCPIISVELKSEKTQRDNKYCYILWKDWVLYCANLTGEVIPLLHNITVEELQH